jgi:hypothetical protein
MCKGKVVNHMGITFRSLLDCLPFVTAIHKPIMLRGRHGIGKSCVVYQYAQSINLPIIERRVSQMTEGDIVGLPKIESAEEGTDWILPKFLVQACNEPVVLFFDELDRGTPEVRQSIFELCDSHKIAGHNLHPQTLIFAAINGGDSGSQYQVGELDPAELDRWTVFDIEPSIEDWLVWAKEANVHPVIWDFINKNHIHLEHKSDFEPNKVYPSRRSWHRFSDCLVAGAKNLLVEGEVNATVANLALAFIGLEGCVAFIKTYSYQVTIEDILDHGKFDKVQNFLINDHLTFIEKFASVCTSVTALGLPQLDANASAIEKKNFEKAYQNRLTNLATYFKMIPSEIAMKLLSALATVSPKYVIDLHKQPGVQIYLTKILTTDGDKILVSVKEK